MRPYQQFRRQSLGERIEIDPPPVDVRHFRFAMVQAQQQRSLRYHRDGSTPTPRSPGRVVEYLSSSWAVIQPLSQRQVAEQMKAATNGDVH